MSKNTNGVNDNGNVESNKDNKAKKFMSKAGDFIDDYRNAGSLKGMAKNAIKDKASEKLNDKKDQLKGKINDKINDKLPESVRKKRAETQSKKDALNNQKKNPRNANGSPINQAKAKLNEQVFKKGVRAAADAFAPGTGEVAEKLLDTPKGEEALDAARAASNPVSAVKEGTKKLVEIVIKDRVKQHVTISMLPVGIVMVVIFILLLSTNAKAGDSNNYFRGDVSGNTGMAAVSEEYKDFYEAVEEYGTTNRQMIVAVLTAHTDNDKYKGDISEEIDSCTDEEVESGDCFEDTSDSGETTYSKSEIKKYIKKVNKAIQESGGDVSEGEYDDPQNTGSKFFKWLYNDFVEEYYQKYITKEEDKEWVIHEIYLLYEQLLGNTCSSGAGGYDTTCDFNLTKVKIMDCSNQKLMAEQDLKTYLLGVTLGEIDTLGDDEHTFKAFIIAAKTYVLQRAGYNSSTKEISIRSCTMDQVWCDIENGCNSYKYNGYTATRSKAYSELTGGSNYKQPLSTDRKEKWSKWYDEVYQYLYLDRNKFKGPITELKNLAIGYYDVQQKYWHKQSTEYNKKFDEVFAGTPSSKYFHYDSLEGEDLGIYDLGSYCKKISGGTTVAGKYVYYSQVEEPWRSMKHGCSGILRFSKKGCFQTSSAMVLSSLLGREITPKDTNDFTASKKNLSCGGVTSNYTHFQNIAKAYGLTVEMVDNGKTTSAQKMLDALSQGRLITQILDCPGKTSNGLCLGNYGHAIVIVPGSKPGYVTVLDSMTPERPTLELPVEDVVAANVTKNSFYIWGLAEGTTVSGTIDSNNPNLVTTGGLSNACVYTPSNKYDKSIYVGDSRTVGMCSAESLTDNCIAESGMGYDWLSGTALTTLKEKLNADPKVNVIINMGTNDLHNSEKYAGLYKTLSEEYPNTNFIITSVTQIDDELAKANKYEAKNSQVVNFNTSLKSKLPSKVKYCDVYTKIKDNYKTTDGIHYDNDTYKKIFKVINEC